MEVKKCRVCGIADDDGRFSGECPRCRPDQHTCGPWEFVAKENDTIYSDNGILSGVKKLVNKDGHQVIFGLCSVNPDVCHYTGDGLADLCLMESDARLIEAAPGLLAALKDAAEMLRWRTLCRDEWRGYDERHEYTTVAGDEEAQEAFVKKLDAIIAKAEGR